MNVTNNQLNAKEIGARIRLARKEADGMTQEELGHLVGVTSRSVAEWEAGGFVPFRYLGKIEAVLSRSKAWFLYGDEATPAPSVIEGKLDEILKRLTTVEKALKKQG